MELKYQEQLRKLGLSVDEVSHRLRQDIKRINKLVGLVADAKNQLQSAKTEAKKNNLQNEILTGEENISAMDEEITRGIIKFYENKDANVRKAAHLKAVRERSSKGNNADKKPADDSNADGSAQPSGTPPTPTSSPEPPATPNNVGDDPSAVSEPKKKKSSAGWLLVGGIILTAAAAFIGIKLKNKE